ncbi:MAG TPA: hypothetical protein VHP32_02720 [Ignavibacteria bacterium]|nr:hypothetical protein [Ignavibacteria bacterium]
MKSKNSYNLASIQDQLILNLNKELVKKLRVRFRNLTHDELKICALVKSNLDDAKIKHLLSLSDNTLKAFYNKISKKLKIPLKTQLHNYLTKI